MAGRERNPEEAKLWLSEETDQANGNWPTPPAQPLVWYLEMHDRIRHRSFEALRSTDPERIVEGRQNRFTVRWVLAHVVEHDSYTGGQAVLLHELWKKLAR